MHAHVDLEHIIMAHVVERRLQNTLNASMVNKRSLQMQC